MQLAEAAPPRVRWRSAVLAVAMASMMFGLGLPGAHARAAMMPTGRASAPDVADASDGTGSACSSQPAYKAVIVVGPVGGSTSRFIGWADDIAAAARDAGMSVCKVYTPHADAATLKAAARGADLFVTLMHGNGYPSPSGSHTDGDDATAHGLGLDASQGSSSVKYYGADWVRSNLHLAPNAIVILSHMCYTAGNSEDDDAIPTFEWAVRHVDNFAQGFLASTSTPSGGHPSVVMGLQSQGFDTTDPRGTLIKTLMTSPSKTLDQAFMTTYTRNGESSSYHDAYLPSFGGIGTTDFYISSRPDGTALRSPGRIHMDPDMLYPGKTPPKAWDPQAPDIAWLDRFAGKSKGIANPAGAGLVRFAYVRSITGDLGLTASDWRAGASVPPELVAVPDVRGETVSRATSLLEDAGFTVGDQVRVYSSDIAEGHVTNTDPPRIDGDRPARYPRGSTLDLRVSKGPEPTSGPDPAPTPTPDDPPRLMSLTVDQAEGTIPASDDSVPVFTPNGDGTSDRLTIRYQATAAASLPVTIIDASDTVVRSFTVDGRQGAGHFGWNGATKDGSTVRDGTYRIRVRMPGGNSRSTLVKVLTAIEVPSTSRDLLHASDGDGLAGSATQSVSVARTARISWRILDAAGEAVRTGLDDVRATRGTTSWAWDGKDDTGEYVPDGTYTSVVTATTSKGSYSHLVTVQVMAYRLDGDPSAKAGQSHTFAITAAEPQRSTPTITVKQRGVPAYELTLHKTGSRQWSAVWKARPGQTGRVTFRISGKDSKGGLDSTTWKGSIEE